MSGGDVRTDIGDGSIFERERTDDGAYCRGLDDIRASEDDRVINSKKAKIWMWYQFFRINLT